MNILIIEDDEVWQQQVHLMLDKLPENQVEFASTLTEARVKLNTFRPHLVVADVILPDGLSFELFQAIEHIGPIIFMTAFASHKTLNQALQLPNSTFVVKPFHELTLLAAIRLLMKAESVSKTSKTLEVLGKFRQKVMLPYEAIVYVEADGNYMKIYTTDKIYSYKSSLKELIALLDDRFLQIHKSFLVNTAFVNRVDLTEGVVLVKRNELPIGRAYRPVTIARLAQTM